MLSRPVSERIPIAFIPNGSGNDTCFGLGIQTAEQAIEFILKGETVKMDVNKVLMDAENEDEIPIEEKTSRMRYSIINASIGFIAKAVHRAKIHKNYVGNLCYTTAGFFEIAGGLQPEDF